MHRQYSNADMQGTVVQTDEEAMGTEGSDSMNGDYIRRRIHRARVRDQC